MNTKHLWLGRLKVAKAVILLVAFLFTLIPVSPAFAQEAETPAESQSPTESVSETPLNTPSEITETKDTPSVEEPVKEEPIEQPKEEPMKEEPKEEAPQPEALRAGSEQGNGVKFELPTQAEATVDQSTGALMYDYPIQLPQGRAGMTPELSLKYDSRNSSRPDSYAGLGWDLSIPYIQREAGKGTQSLYSKAYFSSSISGNLISTTDTSSTQYTTYRPEVDNGEYLKYTYNSDNTWTVTGKDGRTYTFGGSAASRQDNPSDSTKVFKWMVSKISDPNGNEIQYSYTKDAGQIYPNQILYTYHASSPAVNTVSFSYTTPTNYGSTIYSPAFAVTTSKLLGQIVVSTTVGANTSTDTYSFTYNDAQFLKQKVLVSIEKVYFFASSSYSQSFPGYTYFDYSTKTGGWEQGTHALGSNYNYTEDTIYKDTYTADFDLNGYPDVFISNLVSGTYTNKLMLNSGTAFTDAWSSWGLPSNVDFSYQYVITDLNGDRLPDLHPRNFDISSPLPVYLNTGSGFTSDTSRTWLMDDYISEVGVCASNEGDALSNYTNTFLYDINRDGKNDLVYFGGDTNFKVYLNDGSGWNVSTAYTFTINPGSSYDFSKNCQVSLPKDYFQTLIDVNGDGLEDYVHIQYGTYLNTGSGFAYNAAYSLDTAEGDKTGFADINNDGLLDYIAFKYHGSASCSRVNINNGAGFTMVSPSNTTSCTATSTWNPADLQYTSYYSSTWGSLIDVTADGYPDIIGSKTNDVNGKLRSINDSKSAWVTNPDYQDPWKPIVAPSHGIYFDVNSDGIMDFINSRVDWGDGNCQTATYRVCMGKSSIPNRLTKITNMLGAETVVEYSTKPTNYSDTDPSPMSVVSKVTVQNIGMNQPSMVTQYAYSGGEYVYDTLTSKRRFSGFQKVTATESGTDLTPLRITDTYFHQANGSDSATNEPTDTSLALIGKPYYSLTKHPSGTPKKETWNKYGTYTLVTEPVTNRLSKFVYPTETVNKTTESSGSTATADVYTFNTTLGEQTELRNMGLVTAGTDGTYTDISGDTRYQFTEYANNSGSTIVKPKRLDIRTSSASGDTIARTDYFYDSQAHGTISTLGNLTKETNWIAGNGSTTADTTYTYDSFGNVLTVTNPRNATTTYTYDTTKSLVETETNHLNHTTSYEYITGKRTKATDPNGRVITYQYSNKGWLYKTITANTGGTQTNTQFLYQDTGQQWSIQTQLQLVDASKDYSYQAIDRLSRPVRSVRRVTNHATNVNGQYFLKEATTYNSLGQAITTSAPYGTGDSDYLNQFTVSVPSNLVTTTTYDIFDRPTSVVNALGTTSMSYAGSETTTTDAENNQKKLKTDAYGNLIQVKEYNNSSEYVTSYTYDNRNLLTGITDALGNVRAFTYNNAGWLTNSEDLHASADAAFGSYSYTYDLNGNVLVETQPNGVTVTKVYDMLDRPTSIDGSTTGSTDYTYTYDSCTYGKGYLCSVSGTLPNSITLNKSFVYGISGVPTSTSLTTLGNTYTTSYLYNYSDQVSKITYPNNTVVRYTFGDWALPYTVYTTLPGGSETTYATTTYHHTEKPDTLTITNGPTISHTYDSAKLYRESAMTATMGGNTLQSYGYSYDNVNNITQITEPNLTKTYSYDDLNRLTQAVHTPSGGGATTYTYAYNALGNITSANGNSYTYSGTGKTNPHAVTSIGSNNYTYDDNGNMTVAPNQVITNNWQNKPTRIVVGGSTNIDSYYDENGQRFIYQTPSTTEIQAESNYLLRGSTPEVSIMLANIPIGTINNNTIYSAISDHLGTSVKQVNSSGVVVEGVTYDPFGAVLTQTGTLNSKKGYTGHEEDVDTGLVYAEARYYNPAIGRFVSQDNVHLTLGDQKKIESITGLSLAALLSDPQTLNSYSYARNNPIVYTDPDGNIAFLAPLFYAAAAAALAYAPTAINYFNSLLTPLGQHALITSIDDYQKGNTTAAVVGVLTAGSGSGSKPAAKGIVSGVSNVGNKIGKGIDVAQSARQAGVAEVSPLLNVKGLSQWDDIIDPARQTHILMGDATGGGHAFGAGRGRSEFPQSWTHNDILRNTADIATDPNTQWIRQRNGNWRGEGVRDGVTQRVILNNSKSRVITTHPVTRRR